MAKVVIFGNELTAELALFYLQTDSEHEVVAFTVNQEYIKEPSYKGLPLVPFEEVEKLYPPTEFSFFAPLTEREMNRMRARIYQEAKDKGYSFISYISSKATVLTDQIGENCFILEDNTIQPFVKIGNNCVLWSGNHIGHHGTIGDHVFFTSHVVLSGRCIVGDYCFFGVNATIRDLSNLGEGTLIAMGSNLTKQKTEPWTIWKGNPAEVAKISSKDIKI
ncbi:acetyltransferase [Sandaracinomonas limnophila]|uniref:Acetyltransferase n=1 Tax=Sandaracinomonas limnophila TaxID=1862386 RepID=A0A437PUL7_9BACT|nr:acetyltransferase [Sandaracinomonas limnophila]RVU25942.1 acetyltransferase [Sandaracinomonas limnophila]